MCSITFLYSNNCLGIYTEDRNCVSAGTKPISVQTCNTQPCVNVWQVTSYGDCSKACSKLIYLILIKIVYKIFYFFILFQYKIDC